MWSRAWCLSLIGVVTALPLSGCLTLAAVHQLQEQREYERRSAFDAAAHDWALAPGEPVAGRLVLTASYRRGYGGRVEAIPDEILTCEGLSVRLIPDTPHMRWLIEQQYRLIVADRGDWRDGLGETPQGWVWPEAATARYVRETRCGPNGAFTFASPPPGPYLLLAQLHPTAERADFIQSDLVLKPVDLKTRRPLDVHIRSRDALQGPMTPR